MQYRDDVCRVTASAIEAPHGAPRGSSCAAVKEIGKTDQSVCGESGSQFDGKSRVIHTLRNGFRETGAECVFSPALRYSKDGVAPAGFAWLGRTSLTTCDHAPGSGKSFAV